jgi:hypothetical protein
VWARWGRGGWWHGEGGTGETVVRGPVVGLACRACTSESAGEGGRKGASASFIDEVRRFARRGLQQLAVNSNSGSAEGASVEAAKPVRTLQRHGQGGDAEVGGTARCRRQCAVPSWGRRVARAQARVSAGEGNRKGVSASFIDEVRRFARWKKISRPALCAMTPIYGEVGAAIFA